MVQCTWMGKLVIFKEAFNEKVGGSIFTVGEVFRSVPKKKFCTVRKKYITSTHFEFYYESM